MEYQVALDPSLGMKIEEFIAAWNDNPEARQVATAQLHHSSGRTQYDSLTAIAILAPAIEPAGYGAPGAS